MYQRGWCLSPAQPFATLGLTREAMRDIVQSRPQRRMARRQPCQRYLMPSASRSLVVLEQGRKLAGRSGTAISDTPSVPRISLGGTAMAPVTRTTVLKTAIATYANTKALKDGTVTASGLQFEHIEVSPIVAAFRRMCRTLEFDVSEMAITTYLTAKAYHKPFTALPVFIMRQFHHSPIVYNVKSGVRSPKDLEGKQVRIRIDDKI